MSKRVCLAAVAALALTVPQGCDDRRRPVSPAEHFKARQASTVTPHGRIVTNTVEEQDGKIQYQTNDGKKTRKWRVGYSKRADGTYEYQSPEEVK